MSPHPMFSEDMLEIVDSFVVETQEILENLDQDLVLLESQPDDMELINRIFRSVHTIKGTSGFLSFDQMSTLAHRFEDVLNKMRKGQLTFQPWMMDTLLEAYDQMKTLLQQVIDRNIQDIPLDALLSRLTAIAEGQKLQGPEPTEPTSKRQSAPEEPTPKRKKRGRKKQRSAPSSSQPAESTPVQDSPETHSKTADGYLSRGHRLGKVIDSTIRVDVERLDNLMNLVGELVLGRNRLAQIVNNLKSEASRQELADTTAQIDFITSELQSAVMKTRMVQIGRIFNKFPRLVRDLSREFQKEIDLILEGEETELDKSVIEEISDPLVHLIRNSVDHGIESPDERETLGKPRKGMIRLAAGHEGNHIIIEVEDDGRGIDPEKIKRKAIEKGIISADDAKELSDAEVYNLIFMPGFSTAQKVTNVSGRGVGMDVVKTNITKLNGMITVKSQVGVGTTFILKLPLTLAIIQGLLVQVAQEVFAVPLSSVIEVVRTSREEVHTIHGEEVIRLREKILPLVHIRNIYSVSGNAQPERFYTVVVGIANRVFGLVVDDLLGQKEIVIKPLGAYLKNTPGIAGSTILGDGRVIMILDIGEMLKLIQKHQKGALRIARTDFNA